MELGLRFVAKDLTGLLLAAAVICGGVTVMGTAAYAQATYQTARGNTTTANTAASGLNVSRSMLALQGDCSGEGGTRDTRGTNANVSTISCPGESSSSLSFTFSDGTSESCLYIDNNTSGGYGRTPVSYFVPLNSAQEWTSFRHSVQSGTLSSSVSLVYGCESATLTSTCGTSISVPAKRNTHTEIVIVTPYRTETYTCTATSGCGTWNLTSSTGHCPINRHCGAADGVAVHTVPSTNLCDAGTASTVSGSGPWNWSCAGQYGGTSESCSAPMVADGVCGASNGTSMASAPTTGLCDAGTASAVSGSGPWSWSCAGDNSGVTVSCSASKTPPACTPSWTVTGTGPCSATCGGGTQTVTSSDGCGNTSTSSQACNMHACATNGACGASNGLTLSSAPADGYCNAGSFSGLSGSGSWYWSCNGASGGSNANCSANKTTRDCGGGQLIFTGAVQVSEEWGAGSAGRSCTPNVGVGLNVTLPALANGQSTSGTGSAPDVLTLGEYDAGNCDRSFIQAYYVVSCNDGHYVVNDVGAGYWSGRRDRGIYNHRGWWFWSANPSQCTEDANRDLYCSGGGYPAGPSGMYVYTVE